MVCSGRIDRSPDVGAAASTELRATAGSTHWTTRDTTAEARPPQTPEAPLRALADAAPHLDRAAIEGLKKQLLPPPTAKRPEDPHQRLNKAQASERRAKADPEAGGALLSL